MLAALGSSTASHSYSPGASLSGLEAQVARYEKKLGECLNCASSKTSAGKAEIQTISDQISVLKARIAAINQAKSTNPPAGSSGQTAEAQKASGLAGFGENTGSSPQNAANPSQIGSRINLFA